MPELLLAIDAGTTTARAALFTPGGAMAGLASAPVTTRSPGPGLMEQDAQGVWRTVRRLIAGCLEGAGRCIGDVAAIGVTSQRTSAVVWDRRTSRPLSPLVLWNDLRGARRAVELRESGVFLAPQQAAAKLEAILATAGCASANLAWGNIDSFLIFKLSGGAVHATDRSQAWPTGYLDLATLSWNAALIARQGLDEAMFPRLVDTFGPIAITDRSVLGAAVPITADIADQQSALIAHGGGAGRAKVTFGTSATLDFGTGAALVFKSPAVPPFVLTSVGGETTYCLEGMVLSAGSALDWLRGVCRLGRSRFDSLAASVKTAAGAVFLPALTGLGAPAPDPARAALLGGLTAAVGRAHIARAGIEGVAFRVREVFEHVFALADLPPPEVLGVDGGMTQSEVFLQIQADLLGRPVSRHAVREATALGAAICAGRGVGLLSAADAATFVRYERTFEPSLAADEAAARHRAWRAAVHGSAGAGGSSKEP
ncbi:MAG TPA: FGGY family carbohydrate kinase [Caulobacteraceae bacterium]